MYFVLFFLCALKESRATYLRELLFSHTSAAPCSHLTGLPSLIPVDHYLPMNHQINFSLYPLFKTSNRLLKEVPASDMQHSLQSGLPLLFLDSTSF